MLHSPSLRRIQDDRRNTGRAFVARRTINAPGFEQRPRGGVGAASRDTYGPGMRSARQERPERDDPSHTTALGHIEELLRIGLPSLMGLEAAKEEEAVPAIPWMPCKELAQWAMDVAAPITPQPHLGPFLSKHDKLFRLYPGQPLGPEIAGQVTQGARCRPTGINPSPKRHDHRLQVRRRLAVELYVVHECPLGPLITRCRGRSTIAGRCDGRSRWATAATPARDRRRLRRHAPPCSGSHRGRT